MSGQSSSNHSEPKSYLELIQEHLRKYEEAQHHEEQEDHRQHYNLYEDLKIIVVIATDETQSRLGT